VSVLRGPELPPALYAEKRPLEAAEDPPKPLAGYDLNYPM